MQQHHDFTVVQYRGLPCLRLADGRYVPIPSGGEGDDPPPADPSAAANPPADPPASGQRRKSVSETFTPEQQSFINRLLKQQKEEVQKENAELNKTVSELRTSQGRFDTFMGDLEKQLRGDDPPDPSKPFDEWLQSITPPEELGKDTRLASVYETFARERYRNQQTINELKKTITDISKSGETTAKEIAEERKRREAAEARAVDARKRSLLADILSRNKVVDPARVARMYADDVVYDAEHDRFRYRTGDGELVDPVEAISRDIPDWAKRPAASHGGSGSQGGRPVEAPPAAEQSIAEMEATLQTIGKRVQQGGASHQDITAVMRLRREIKDAKAKQAKASAA